MEKTLFNFDREQVFVDSGLNLKVSKKAFPCFLCWDQDIGGLLADNIL